MEEIVRLLCIFILIEFLGDFIRMIGNVYVKLILTLPLAIYEIYIIWQFIKYLF